MSFSIILDNFLNPPVLFFFLGVAAVLVKSNLEMPEALSKFFSMYLLFSIGFKGGVELVKSGFSQEHFLLLLACSVMATIVPIYSYFILRAKLDVHNAAAIAASYGSVSAVTFVTAGAFLHTLNLEFGGFIVAGMALMESPAIVLGVLIDRIFGRSTNENGEKESFSWKELLHEAFFSGSIFLLVGALIIGALTGEHGWKAEKAFADDMFKGFLSFFLLDMGLSAAKRLGDLKKSGLFLVAFGILMPLFNAMLGIGLAKLIGAPRGDALMFTVLCASASYIAVPAAMRMAIPQANPSLYLPMALAITFPFNIIVGIPLYYYLITQFIGG